MSKIMAIPDPPPCLVILLKLVQFIAFEQETINLKLQTEAIAPNIIAKIPRIIPLSLKEYGRDKTPL